MGNEYSIVEHKGTKYVACVTEAVAVGVINGQLDLCHYDEFTEDADIGRDGGMTCPAHAALNVIDLAGLNTTANELRAKLEEATSQVAFRKARHADDNTGLAFQLGRNLEFAQEAAYRCGATEPHPTIRSIQIVEEKVAELTAQLAEANQTIAQLRQADTVRPAASTCGCRLVEMFHNGELGPKDAGEP